MWNAGVTSLFQVNKSLKDIRVLTECFAAPQLLALAAAERGKAGAMPVALIWADFLLLAENPEMSAMDGHATPRYVDVVFVLDLCIL